MLAIITTFVVTHILYFYIKDVFLISLLLDLKLDDSSIWIEIVCVLQSSVCGECRVQTKACHS